MPVSIQQTSDSGYVISGTTISDSASNYDFYVIKTGPYVPSAEWGRDSSLPTQYTLEQNYPNPFNATTTITFTLPKASRAKLAVYDLTGRLVETLADQVMPAGAHTLNLDGSRLPSGIYFARLVSGEIAVMRKMVLLK